MPKFTLFVDPGHGWLKVSIAQLKKLAPEVINSISPYSYMTPTAVFLEEDCDAPLFLKALTAKNIVHDHKVSHTNNRSKIRSYGSYDAYFVENPLADGSCVSLIASGGNYIVVTDDKHKQAVLVPFNSVVFKYRLPWTTAFNFVAAPIE